MRRNINEFPKDILLYDFETTHGVPKHAEPTQLAAILLDRETLQERTTFSSYIHNTLKNGDPEALAISGITAEQLKDAPTMAEVGRDFMQVFGTDVLLCSWNEMLDRRMLQMVIEAAGHEIAEYDYHYLDLWPIAHIYLVKRGKGDVLRSSQIFREFGLPTRGSHDALEDCRMAAEVLRNLMKE